MLLPAETLGLFLVASVALALAPGPDNLFVLMQSALHGRLAGLLVTLGLSSGLLVHTAMVALGVAAIFQTSALAFTLLKAAGAAYLIYLAWMTLRAPPMALDGSGAPALSARQLYTRGIVMNVTNPKVTIFFLAFLPQFVSAGEANPLSRMLALSAVFMLMTFVVFAAYGATAALLRDRVLSRPRLVDRIRKTFAASFAVLGARLAVESR